MSPVRIQRKRTKGWKMPENAVYVGRVTEWGNRYRIGHLVQHVDGIERFPIGATEAVQLYREWLDWQMARFPTMREGIIRQLRGKDLACWCRPDLPCHADVLLEIANGPASQTDRMQTFTQCQQCWQPATCKKYGCRGDSR